MSLSTDSSKMERFEIFINTLCHSFIAITTFYLTWYCFHVGFSKLITYHVYFCTLGYQLMTEGILAMYKQNTLTLLAHTKAQKTFIHWQLQAIGSLLSVIGIIIQIISRNQLGKLHFSQTHSILGLVSFVFLILTIVSGCSALFSIELKKHLKPIYNKLLHNILALIAFITGISSIANAYLTKTWIKRNDPGELRYVMFWLVILIAFLTSIGPIKTLWHYMKTITKR
ncbi:hypothetical protein PVAND_006647 [Polypedilum vanderplanki]|uniref:ascorbate ferrireductase (transmembrane) n=1 Tax=Polypedilum vanderplanki TaxID=319348 RepID=A0A9J6C4R4_POLVA|nr:hypothetical protein PVAND_006647 [Polypedilum vanderplanki]